jgi:branched-chain amino acid transport system substrate-binding protein
MNKKPFFIIIILLLLIINGCNSHNNTINIGHIGPMTGDDALYGLWEKEGIDLAISYESSNYNLKDKIKVLDEDDASEPTKSVNSLYKLYSNDKVCMVIGPTLSSSVLACAPVANEKQIVLLTPSAQSPKLKTAGDFIFQLFISSSIEGKYLSSLADTFKISNIAIISHSSDYGIGILEVLKKEFQHSNKNIVDIEIYPKGTTDYRTFINKINLSKPEAIYILSFPNDLAKILLQLRENNYEGQIFAPDSFEDNYILKIAKNATDKVIYIYPTIPPSNKYYSIKEKFFDRYNKEMNYYNAVGYDAAALYLYIINKLYAKGIVIDGSSIKSELYNIRDFEGVSGIINFDENGDVIERPMEIRIVENGFFKKFK